MSLLKNNLLLKQAFLDADRQLLYQYSGGKVEVDWMPSVRFENKMRKLIRAQKHSYWKYINTVSKRVAIIVLAILITFASAMSVKAIREPIVSTIIEIYEKFTQLIFSTDSDDKDNLKIGTRYSLSYLPETFIEKDILTFEQMLVVSWENEAGEIIELQQSMLGSEYKLDTEENALVEIDIGSIKGHSYISRGYENWIWHNETFTFNLSFPQKHHDFFVEVSEKEGILKIIE